MLRGPPLDVPGILDHVMVRGIDRCAIFRDGHARADLSRPRGSRPGGDPDGGLVRAWSRKDALRAGGLDPQRVSREAIQ